MSTGNQAATERHRRRHRRTLSFIAIDRPSTSGGGRRLELVASVLMTLAAVATAWASYQSARWHGQQAKAQGASIATRLESTRADAVAGVEAQVDVTMFTQWLDAYAGGQRRLADFYRRRFRPEFRPAFAAWIATRPRENPQAPPTPFAMSRYRLAAAGTADRLQATSAGYARVVGRDIQRADNYLLAVVLFAVALFFAGISTKLDSRLARSAILAVGYLLFAGTADRLQATSAGYARLVGRDIQRADNYLLAVVLFAAALFFAGISTKLDSRPARSAILAVGYLLFAGTVAWIATFPVTVAL